MDASQALSQVIDTVFEAVRIRGIDRQSVGRETGLGRAPGGPAGTSHAALGLDSVDILEVVVAVEHAFKVKVGDKETGQAVFRTLGTIADYVLAQSPLFAPPVASASPVSSVIVPSSAAVRG